MPVIPPSYTIGETWLLLGPLLSGALWLPRKPSRALEEFEHLCLDPPALRVGAGLLPLPSSGSAVEETS